MLKIYNIKEKQEYLPETIKLCMLEWGKKLSTKEEFDKKLESKTNQLLNKLDNRYFARLILLDDDKFVGFISLFETDGEERQDLKPWYATMYVKEEYRGMGYSKILNDALIEEARNRGFDKVYLKTDLVNYYEKFGANYIENLKNGEKLYYIRIK